MEHWRRVVAIVSLTLLAGVLGACRPNRPYMPASQAPTQVVGAFFRQPTGRLQYPHDPAPA